MSEWENYLVGKTLTSIEDHLDEDGNTYTRFNFGDTFYEFLKHFTLDEHKVFIAEKALRSLAEVSPDLLVQTVAKEALLEMEKFN